MGSTGMRQLDRRHRGSVVSAPCLKHMAFRALFYNVLFTLENAQLSQQQKKNIYPEIEKVSLGSKHGWESSAM